MHERAPDGAVLFDLDGTFADTAPDMAGALNRLLATHGRPPLRLATIRPHVSSGARGMLQIGFGLAPGDTGFERLRAEFLDLYARAICQGTLPFPGILELVERIEQRRVPWGIVTNKPARLTEALMAGMTPQHRLAERAACIVSGDTAPRPKPHPDPLLHACRLIDRPPERCWYIGDDPRDIAAGRSAGMRTLAATYGYLGVAAPPGRWGADGLIAHPLDVLQWLNQPRAPGAVTAGPGTAPPAPTRAASRPA